MTLWIGISVNTAAKHMNIRAAQMINYGRKGWVTVVPTPLVFYSIPFYSILQFSNSNEYNV
jgi:hypothetical protein